MPARTVAKRHASRVARKAPPKMPTLGDAGWFVVSRVAWPVVAWSSGHALRGCGRCIRWSARNSGRMAATGARALHIKTKTAYGQHKEWRGHKARHGLRATMVHCGGCGDKFPANQMSEHMARHDVLDAPARPLAFAGAQVRADEPRPPIWAMTERLDRLELPARPAPLPADPDGLRRCGACEFHGTERAYQKHLPVCARRQLASKQQARRDTAILAAIEDRFRDPSDAPLTPQSPAQEPAPATAPAGKEIAVIDPTGAFKGADVFTQPSLVSTDDAIDFFELSSREFSTLVERMAAFHSVMTNEHQMPKGITTLSQSAVEHAKAMQDAFDAMKKYGQENWAQHPKFQKVA